ncbi:hypothetical protein ACFSE0_20760 [Ochrobactrum teleogrylli]|uniref:Uncharacterized protein n=1 Tax=Ochrobactrum teleogrylli TaxID=2479765 RepID=A0ABY2Y216_9HYPH|nr:hypothetical protein [[Ochrobactrum] teleogrylli]TNV13862.1 hypothetical protein FIC94_14755 [[Ochrobactrum] teleogrylli]
MVVGTFKFDISEKRELRMGATEKITVFLDLNDPLPDDSSKIFATLSSNDYNAVISGAKKRLMNAVPSPDPKVPPKRYTADFFINVAPNLVETSLVSLTVVSNIVVESIPGKIQVKVGRSANVTAVSPDPNPIYFTTVETIISPELSAQKAEYSLTILDNNKKPIKDYIVEWGEQYNTGSFKYVMAFDSLNSTNPLIPDFDDQATIKKEVYRTVTDSKGVATIFFLPGMEPAYLAVRCTAVASQPQTYSPIVIFDALKPSVYALQEPGVELGRDQQGNLDLNTSAGDTVNCVITTNSSSFYSTDTLILFFADDNKLATYFNVFFDGPVPPAIIDLTVRKAFFKTGAGDTNRNKFYYVVADKIAGVVTSLFYRFNASGGRGENKPDPTIQPRDLPAPVVENLYLNTVNLNTIENGFLNVKVDVAPGPGWMTPKAGDAIILTIYLNGLDPKTGSDKNAAFDAKIILSSTDITNGSVKFQFARGVVQGYESYQLRPGDFYAEYFVQPAGSPQKIYSMITWHFLDTVAPTSLKLTN